MSAALLIDVLLWGSVVAVGFIAYRRGPQVLTLSLREGSTDFIRIIPRRKSVIRATSASCRAHGIFIDPIDEAC